MSDQAAALLGSLLGAIVIVIVALGIALARLGERVARLEEYARIRNGSQRRAR